MNGSQDMGDIGSTRNVLGRGLAALIPTQGGGEAEKGDDVDRLRLLPIERIHPNSEQPRKEFDEEKLQELAASIKDCGILQPLVVKRHQGEYMIVAGERRWRAAGLAGLIQVPAIIREFDNLDTLKVALIENIQRQDLDPLEEAYAYKRLLDEHDFTQESLAEELGKKRTTLANSLRLLQLPEVALGLLRCGSITPGHARALMMVPDVSEQDSLAQRIVSQGMSVRQAEESAKRIKAQRASNKGKPSDGAQGTHASPDQRALEERLMKHCGTKVRLKCNGKKGSVEIFFHSFEHLDGIIDSILGTRAS